MAKTKIEKIAGIEEEIRQLENKVAFFTLEFGTHFSSPFAPGWA